jgi:hypothetical protein
MQGCRTTKDWSVKKKFDPDAMVGKFLKGRKGELKVVVGGGSVGRGGTR